MRCGQTSSPLKTKARENEFVMEGLANDVEQKIIDGGIVNKTVQEIQAQALFNPAPENEKPININDEQYQSILDRLTTLESK